MKKHSLLRRTVSTLTVSSVALSLSACATLQNNPIIQNNPLNQLVKQKMSNSEMLQAYRQSRYQNYQANLRQQQAQQNELSNQTVETEEVHVEEITPSDITTNQQEMLKKEILKKETLKKEALKKEALKKERQVKNIITNTNTNKPKVTVIKKSTAKDLNTDLTKDTPKKSQPTENKKAINNTNTKKTNKPAKSITKNQEYVTTKSGLKYKVLREGTGQSPKNTDTVTVHYSGQFSNGMIFDSSYARGKTSTFGLNQVITGWTEGLQLMQEGSKYQFFVPADLAYGDSGAGSIPPNTPLIFVVELIDVQ